MIYRTETVRAQKKRLMQWHRWFAWYPISQHGVIVWLSSIERRAIETSWDGEGGFIWEYRWIGDTD